MKTVEVSDAVVDLTVGTVARFKIIPTTKAPYGEPFCF